MAERRNGQSDLAKLSVQEMPDVSNVPAGGASAIGGFGNSVTLMLASMADDLPAWGPAAWNVRDRKLREFLPTESVIMSAIYSICASNSALSWQLEGPPRTVDAVQNMLLQADFGRGWVPFMTKLTLDLTVCDNGAFVETIRTGPNDTDPVVGVANLDSNLCQRTGDPHFPVVYWDTKGVPHKMASHQVIALTEFPSTWELARGLQYSALTRILRMAQIVRSLSLYYDEKISGRNVKAVHLVSGIATRTLDDAIRQAKQSAANGGMIRYMDPIIVAGLDPAATVSKETIELSSLPDNFDFDNLMNWYMKEIAIALGRDILDFVPMPGSNLGTGAQSQVMAGKSRGRGPALFMKIIAHAFNQFGVVPRNVEFRFDEPDAEHEAMEEAGKKARADRIGLYVDKGILNAATGRQVLVDTGDLSQEVFDLMAQADVTERETLQDTDSASAKGASQDAAAAAAARQPKQPVPPVPPTPVEGQRAEPLPDDRDANTKLGKLTNAYQTKMVTQARTWSRKAAERLASLSAMDARALVPGLLGELQESLIAIGEEGLPEAWRVTRPDIELTDRDIQGIEQSVSRNERFIRDSLMPYARSLLERGIEGAEAIRTASA